MKTRSALMVGIATVVTLVPVVASGGSPPNDLGVEGLNATPEALMERLLSVVEEDIVPLTREGTKAGNKLFGAAIIRKDDLSLVIASTNRETGNPLNHGEIQTINEFYELPADQRPPANECVFLSTHEPCPLCLSGITWGGFDVFTFLFTYEDSRDEYGIPHDLKLLKEVFRIEDGEYAKENDYWKSFSFEELIRKCPPQSQEPFRKRILELRKTYAELSDVYQASKGDNTIPLK